MPRPRGANGGEVDRTSDTEGMGRLEEHQSASKNVTKSKEKLTI